MIRESDAGRALEAALIQLAKTYTAPSAVRIGKRLSREHLAFLLGWGSHRGFEAEQLATKLEATA